MQRSQPCRLGGLFCRQSDPFSWCRLEGCRFGHAGKAGTRNSFAAGSVRRLAKADITLAWPHFGQRWGGTRGYARQYARPQPAHGASPAGATRCSASSHTRRGRSADQPASQGGGSSRRASQGSRGIRSAVVTVLTRREPPTKKAAPEEPPSLGRSPKETASLGPPASRSRDRRAAAPGSLTQINAARFS